MGLGAFSSSVAPPEGLFTRLSNKEKEQALQFILENESIIREVVTQIVSTGGGSVLMSWVRAVPNGTKVAGSDTLTVTRLEEGLYKCTSSEAFSTGSNGFFQYGVNATLDLASGNGGDGVSPFKAFDSDTAKQTGSTGAQMLFHIPSTSEIWVPDPTDEKIYIHDLNDFTGTVDEISVTIDSNGEAGCVDKDRERVWISGSGAGGGSPLVAYDVSDRTAHNFMTTDNRRALAATSTVLITREGSSLKYYQPNFSTDSLNGSGTTLATIGTPANGNGCWDGEGNFWFFINSVGMQMVNPTTFTTYQHNKPPVPYEDGMALSTSTGHSSLAYDPVRNCIYITLSDNSGIARIWKFFGWNPTAQQTGQWEIMWKVPAPNSAVGLSYVQELDMLYVTDASGFTMQRWHVGSRTKIDSVSCHDDSPENPQVDYTVTASRENVYTASDNFGYMVGQNGTPHYLVRLSYNGDNLSVSGGGKKAVASTLSWGYEILSATEFLIHTFRNIHPPVYVDAGFTAVTFKNA